VPTEKINAITTNIKPKLSFCLIAKTVKIITMNKAVSAAGLEYL